MDHSDASLLTIFSSLKGGLQPVLGYIFVQLIVKYSTFWIGAWLIISIITVIIDFMVQLYVSNDADSTSYNLKIKYLHAFLLDYPIAKHKSN